MSTFLLQASNESVFSGHPVWFPCNFRDTRQSIHQKQFSHTLYLNFTNPGVKNLIYYLAERSCTIWLKDPVLSGSKTLYHLAERSCTIWLKDPVLSGWKILYYLAERPSTIWLKDPLLYGWNILHYLIERHSTIWLKDPLLSGWKTRHVLSDWKTLHY